MQNMKRILVVDVNWLGDAIMTTPAFEAIKNKFPQAYTAVMAPERVKDVFSNNPYIDEIIIFDERDSHKKFLQKLDFISDLRKKNFDTVFLIHRSFTKALVCFLAGIKNRIGYYRKKNRFILNQSINPSGTDIHKQDQYLFLFEKVGINIKNQNTRVYVSQAVKDKYIELIAELKTKYDYLIGINPSANWALKRWPEKNFSMLCDMMVNELKCAVFFVGAKNDTETVDKVIKGMKEKSYNFCGKTNIKELAAIIGNMNLFISNDSGPAHLSASLGTNTIVLFGPTSAELSAPKGESVKIIKKQVSCQIPCYNLSCRDNVCMKNITVEDVFKEAKLILEKH